MRHAEPEEVPLHLNDPARRSGPQNPFAGLSRRGDASADARPRDVRQLPQARFVGPPPPRANRSDQTWLCSASHHTFDALLSREILQHAAIGHRLAVNFELHRIVVEKIDLGEDRSELIGSDWSFALDEFFQLIKVCGTRAENVSCTRQMGLLQYPGPVRAPEGK